jgi:hypothetical protein
MTRQPGFRARIDTAPALAPALVALALIAATAVAAAPLLIPLMEIAR